MTLDRILMLCMASLIFPTGCQAQTEARQTPETTTLSQCTVTLNGQSLEIPLAGPCRLMEDGKGKIASHTYQGVTVYIVAGGPADAEQLRRWKNITPKDECSLTGKYVLIGEKTEISGKSINALLCPEIGVDELMFRNALN